MKEPKKKVSAKRFVEDFRAGKTDEELMEIYGLDHRNLNRLFKKLITKELLDPDEVRIHKTRDRTGDTSEADASVEVDSSERVAAAVGVVQYEDVDPGKCPQCGAPASAKGLTCPECGHVLPGTQRWEEVDRKESLLHRLPPLAWGCVLAVPVGIGIYIFFAYFMYPAMSQETDKRIHAVRREIGSGMTPQEAAKRIALIQHRNNLQAEVSRLVSLDIFSQAEADYSVFTAGAMWAGLSPENQRRRLSELAAAMTQAGIPADFQVVDSGGFTVATVKSGSVQLTESASSLDKFESGLFEKKRPPSGDRDPTLEELQEQARPERRLQQLKDLPRAR